MSEEEIKDVDEKAAGEEPGKDGKWKPSPIEVTHPEHVDPKDIRLFHEPAWRLRMTIEEDRSYLKVKIVRAAPLTQPDRYVCFLDAKDEAICMVEDTSQLGEENVGIITDELAQRYLTARVLKVHSIRNEYGVSYWDVDTDRGRREFVAKSVAENAQMLGDHRMMVLDVDGNRFELADMTALDAKSAKLVENVL